MHGVDYYAPRTHSKGKSYFQYSSYKDWILTYFEALCMLQHQYENVDIISLSAGSFIAIYISQFKYECNINNLFLCGPYMCVRNDFLYNILYKTWLYPYCISLVTIVADILLRYRPKFITESYECVRDIYNKDNLDKDYYEFASYLSSDNEILKMLLLKINELQINGNICILYSKDDYVIPNVNKQISYLFNENIYKKNIEKIQIPSNNEITDRCGHVMFKESNIILDDIDKNIFDRLDLFYSKKKVSFNSI